MIKFQNHLTIFTGGQHEGGSGLIISNLSRFDRPHECFDQCRGHFSAHVTTLHLHVTYIPFYMLHALAYMIHAISIPEEGGRELERGRVSLGLALAEVSPSSRL